MIGHRRGAAFIVALGTSILLSFARIAAAQTGSEHIDRWLRPPVDPEAPFKPEPLGGIAIPRSDDLAALNEQVQQLYNAGNFAEAARVADAFVSSARERHGENDWWYGTAIGWRGSIHQALGRYSEAEPLLKQSSAIMEKRRGPEHLDYSTSLNNLAEFYRVQGRFAEAEPLFHRALALTEKRTGPDHPEVATSITNLAALYQIQGRYADAEPLLQRALAMREKAFGPEHSEFAASLANLASLYHTQGRFAEAEALYRRALALREKTLGSEHPGVGTTLNALAGLYQEQGRYSESEPLFKRALAIREKVRGPEHPVVADSLDGLANLYNAQGRYADAEPLYKRALAIRERALGGTHPTIAASLNNLAEHYQLLGRYAEAEPLLQRALATWERALGPEHPTVGSSLNNLAAFYRSQGRTTEVEPLHKRALAIREKALGLDHPSVGESLNNLAELYRSQGRNEESEFLYKRALSIREKALGAEHRTVATTLGNLGILYRIQGRYAEAEPLYQRALAIREKVQGPNHPDVGNSLSSLALLYRDQGRYAEARPLLEQSLNIAEQALGFEHPAVGTTLRNLALVSVEQGNNSAALAYQRRATSIRIKRGELGGEAGRRELTVSGSDFRIHVLMTDAAGGNRPAQLLETFEMAQWALQTETAYALAQMSARFAAGGDALAQAVRERQDLLARRRLDDAKLREAAGSADAASADVARKDMAAIDIRLAALDQDLATSFPQYAQLASPRPLDVRAVQTALREDEVLVAFLEVPKYAKNLPEAMYAWAITKTDAQWFKLSATPRQVAGSVALLRCGLDQTIWYAAEGTDKCRKALNAAPNTETVRASDNNENLQVLPFDLGRAHDLYKALFGPAESLIQGKSLIVVPSGSLTSLPLHVLITEPRDLEGLPAASEAAGHAKGWLGVRLRNLTKEEAKALDLPEGRGIFVVKPYDDGPAAAAGLASGDIVLSVDGEAVTSTSTLAKAILARSPGAKLQLQLLRNGKEHTLTAALGRTPDRTVRLADYRKAAWLGTRQPITVLPSVSSLKALRQFAKASKAPQPFIGFGNPLLLGPDGNDRRAWERQDCKATSTTLQVASRGIRAGIPKFFRSGLANVEEIRSQYPLPETADELCAVAQATGAAESAVYLGEKASEKTIKALSANGSLAQARVVHFATHGLLAGETEMLGGSKAEPALILSPPDRATQEDDGLLTASEITQLRFDADWVVLSACNTAAGESDKPGAEALSGLARAFFYAGGRALLVSHWAVNSDATVKLITKAFDELKANPKIGRAEALRRSMLALIAIGGNHAHPANWAPFVVVGEGAR